jgi:hypothetical protein
LRCRVVNGLVLLVEDHSSLHALCCDDTPIQQAAGGTNSNPSEYRTGVVSRVASTNAWSGSSAVGILHALSRRTSAPAVRWCGVSPYTNLYRSKPRVKSSAGVLRTPFWTHPADRGCERMIPCHTQFQASRRSDYAC